MIIIIKLVITHPRRRGLCAGSRNCRYRQHAAATPEPAPVRRARFVATVATVLTSSRRDRLPAVGSTLKLRLSLLITALIALLTLAGGAYVVREARDDIRIEVLSTLNLTGHFLDAQLALMRDRWSTSGYGVPLFQLRELGDVRHLSVRFYDSQGRLLDSNEGSHERAPEAPRWFVRLVRAASAPISPATRTVSYNGTVVGQLIIAADPTYEMDEIWATSRGLLELLLLFFVLVNVLVWWAVAHALQPIEYILAALGEVQRGHLGARLPRFGLPEMSRISVGFNHMAETLELSVAENQRLTRRLLQMQEDERRSLARELHDEIGQCLSAIHADAAAIRNRGGAPVRESAEAIVSVTAQIKDMVRGMLQRLRPAELEGLGLEAAVRELVAAYQHRNPQMTCTLRMGQGLGILQPEVSTAAYRVIQECLTNIARHARAQRVDIEVGLSELPSGAPAAAQVAALPGETLRVAVADDGKGFDIAAPQAGFGLMGIRERVKVLDGVCSIDSAPDQGTRICVNIPLPAPGEIAA
jgi:two-component system, NarL family, sensor histidine kinase UhpB